MTPMLHHLTISSAALSDRTSLQVKPILARLKTTLAGSTAALVLSAGLLVGLVQAGTDADGIYGRLLVQCCGTACFLVTGHTTQLYSPAISAPVNLAVLGFLPGILAVHEKMVVF